MQFSSPIGTSGITEIQPSDKVRREVRDKGTKSEKEINVVSRQDAVQTDLVTFEVRPFVVDGNNNNVEFKVKAAFPGEPAPSLFSKNPEDIEYWNKHAFVEINDLAPPREAIIDEDVPVSLKEFGEIPDSFRSTFFYVRNDKLPQLAETGVTTEMNTIYERAAETVADRGYNVEDIFEDKRRELGIENSRITCQFAFATEQEAEENGFRFDPENYTLIEAKIDPEKARVADGEIYGKANMYGNKDTAKTFANEYWERSVTLAEYLSGNHDLPNNGFTEVLAPGEIPTDHLRIVNTK